MKKIWTNFKAWLWLQIITFVSNKFWPDWTYQADFIDEYQNFNVVLKDRNGIIPNKTIKPERYDLTNDSYLGFYNDRVFKLSTHMLFKDIRLNSNNLVDVLLIPKDLAPLDYLKVIREQGKDKAKGIMEHHQIPMDKVIHMEIAVKSKDYLQGSDLDEIKKYLITKLKES